MANRTTRSRVPALCATLALTVFLALTAAGCGEKGPSKLLASYFPEDEGYDWTYEGDDYGHTMTIDSIFSDDDEKTIEVTGSVSEDGAEDTDADTGWDWWNSSDEDESDEEEDSDEYAETDTDFESDEMEDEVEAIDPEFSLQYVISKDSVREVVASGEALPHRFTDAVILKTPVKKNAKWTFTDQDGNEVSAHIEETGKDSDDVQYVKVIYEVDDYDMPDGVYQETRVFKKGKGLTSYEATRESGEIFSYEVSGW